MSEENTLSRMSGINRPLNQAQPYWNNSLAIRQEIQRFESVHPSIYAIYDLIESIPDPVLGQQIRDHVVCIEGESSSFENTLSTVTVHSDHKFGLCGVNLLMVDVFDRLTSEPLGCK